jgi:iron-sulfur cluster assembly accessory protein
MEVFSMKRTGREPTAVRLTDAAVHRVRNLITERDLKDHALRIFVTGGGCSGLKYGIALERDVRDSDVRFNFDGVDVLIDPDSLPYLAGATVDYVDDIMGGGFHIENPNAVANCGCGNSFRTRDSRKTTSSENDCVGA